MTLITTELASQSHHKDDIVKTCKAFRRVPAHPEYLHPMLLSKKKKKKRTSTALIVKEN